MLSAIILWLWRHRRHSAISIFSDFKSRQVEIAIGDIVYHILLIDDIIHLRPQNQIHPRVTTYQ